MSYETDKAAFERTAARLRESARKDGRQLTQTEAKDTLRKILKRKNNL